MSEIYKIYARLGFLLWQNIKLKVACFFTYFKNVFVVLGVLYKLHLSL